MNTLKRQDEAAVPGRWMRSEIFEQAEVVARVIDLERRTAQALAAQLRRRKVRFAVLAARGTSDHAATLGKYVLGCSLGVPAALAAPSITTLYHRPLDLKGVLVVGISQSGRSTDILEYLRAASRAGAITAAVTNDRSSPIARAAEHGFFLHAGLERSVAATKTFTAQAACLYLLAAAWLGGREGARMERGLDAVPRLIEAALGREEEVRSWMKERRGLERCVVIGRGFSYPVALETALKLKEAAGVFAEGASAADFLHGPIAMARRQACDRLRAFLMWSKGAGLSSLRRVEKRLAAAGAAPLRLDVPDAEELFSPFPLAVLGQCAALHLALLKGRDPDKPEGLSKVTRTR
ncbi:MAG: SIS domain-containing protein [Elusimicrobiota bacterium]